MSDPLELARFLAPLRGAPRRLLLEPALETLAASDAGVFERRPRDVPSGFTLRRLVVLPGTGGGHVLLDGTDPEVFRAGTALLPRGRALSRLATGFVRESSRLGLHRLAPRRLALVERADAPGRALHQRFPGLPDEISWNVASGVPGRDQKRIVQFVTRRGRVEAFAKIALTDSARARVEHEAELLVRLAALGIRGVPALLGVERGTASTMLVQGALRGTRSPGILGRAHANFLGALAERTRRMLPLCEIESQRATRAGLAELAGRADPEWLETFAALERALLAAAGQMRLPCALAHGDFTPWNVLVEGSQARAFDWEHARLSAPPGHDALHFALQQAVLVDRRAPELLLAHLRECCAEHLGPLPFVALAAYVLDIAVADERMQLEQRSPFAQVEWLRRARLELARALLAPALASARAQGGRT
ncbi:MAG: phosphotransferase [Planctomycetes bacterium]|nr:phosphotransferase [Planctomycetota bacterium]